MCRVALPCRSLHAMHRKAAHSCHVVARWSPLSASVPGVSPPSLWMVSQSVPLSGVRIAVACRSVNSQEWVSLSTCADQLHGSHGSRVSKKGSCFGAVCAWVCVGLASCECDGMLESHFGTAAVKGWGLNVCLSQPVQKSKADY